MTEKQKLNGYTHMLNEQRRGRMITAIIGVIISIVSSAATSLFVLWCVGAI